jgi:multiple antibiotic resistance protein
METFLLAFIPLFVAIDVLGVLPLYVALTAGMDEPQKKKLVIQATLTAFTVSLVFLVAGKLVFSFLGITESDFRVGGGVVLLVLAVKDLQSVRWV